MLRKAIDRRSGEACKRIHAGRPNVAVERAACCARQVGPQLFITRNDRGPNRGFAPRWRPASPMRRRRSAEQNRRSRQVVSRAALAGFAKACGVYPWAAGAEGPAGTTWMDERRTCSARSSTPSRRPLESHRSKRWRNTTAASIWTLLTRLDKPLHNPPVFAKSRVFAADRGNADRKVSQQCLLAPSVDRKRLVHL